MARHTLPREEEGERLRGLAHALGASELVHLSTCNRVEVLALVPSGADPRPTIAEALTGVRPVPGEAERTLRAWRGEGAVEHVFCVAAGLDSARIGETEIAGQLRRALEKARAYELAGPTLERVVGDALRLARRVHGTTAIGEGRTSLAGIALERCCEVLGAGDEVALIGVSPMTERVAATLAARATPFVVVNRTLARARALVERLGAGRARTLAEFADAPDAVRCLVTSTASSEPVLDGATLARLAPGTRIVDLAVPPDVRASDAADHGIERIGLDEVLAEAARNRDQRMAELAPAREAVDAALASFRRRAGERSLAPLSSSLQRRYREVARGAAERLLRRELAGVDDAQRAALLSFADTLARRFAHLPTTGLRAVAREVGPGAVDAFLAHADQALLAELGEERR